MLNNMTQIKEGMYFQRIYKDRIYHLLITEVKKVKGEVIEIKSFSFCDVKMKGNRGLEFYLYIDDMSGDIERLIIKGKLKLIAENGKELFLKTFNDLCEKKRKQFISRINKHFKER